MRWADLFAMSLGNYGRARLRSVLTTAGVAIGTALVVLLIALATGAEDNVRRSVFSIGDLRLVTVQPFQPGANGLSAVPRTITDEVVAQLRRIGHVESVFRQFDAPLGTIVEGATTRPSVRRASSRTLRSTGATCSPAGTSRSATAPSQWFQETSRGSSRPASRARSAGV